LFEKKVEEARASQLKLWEVRESVDNASMNAGTVQALQAAADSLKTMRLDDDGIHNVLDDLLEHMDEVALDAEYFQQVNTQFDEDELMKDLEALPALEDLPALAEDLPVHLHTSHETAHQLPDIGQAELQGLKEELDNLAVDDIPTGTTRTAVAGHETN
jgi:hypothetical protein